MAIGLDVNGTVQTVELEPDTPLLYGLTNEFGVKGARFGRDLAQSSVLLDDVEKRSPGAMDMT